MNGSEQNGCTVAKRRIKDLSVHFISLVAKAANRRKFLVKQAEAEGADLVEKTLAIVAKDEGKRLVYGVVYAPDEVDSQGDTMGPEEIEKAAYSFMQKRKTNAVDADHDFEPDKGYVAESWLIRKGDPIFPDEPEGAWAVGVKVLDDDTWQRIQQGELTGLSMYGFARVETLAPPEQISNPVLKSSARPVPVFPQADISKDFNEAFARRQLWDATGALRDAIEQAMNDDTVADKYTAVSQATEQFLNWLRRAMGVTKSAQEPQVVRVAKMVADLARRIDAIERTATGRQAIIGGWDDLLRNDEGYKGIRIL